MPILPENKKRYPADWKEIRAGILSECGNRCEFCGVENHSVRDGKTIVLTIAHLDHTPENCARENLRALCQKCHNGYDSKHRAETRGRHRHAKLVYDFCKKYVKRYERQASHKVPITDLFMTDTRNYIRQLAEKIIKGSEQ